jgi:hypothetical protein
LDVMIIFSSNRSWQGNALIKWIHQAFFVEKK